MAHRNSNAPLRESLCNCIRHVMNTFAFSLPAAYAASTLA
jgi:hypothetical protein